MGAVVHSNTGRNSSVGVGYRQHREGEKREERLRTRGRTTVDRETSREKNMANAFTFGSTRVQLPLKLREYRGCDPDRANKQARI